MTGPATPFSFPPHHRLHRAAEFERARKGRRLDDALISIRYVVNDVGHPRLGMAIAARMIPSAVRRNRIRRIVRETFRMAQHELPAVDIFITVRSGADASSNAALVESLQRLWRRTRSA